VRLKLDALLTPDGKPIEMDCGASGAVVAPQASSPRVGLRGRIVWDDPNDPLLHGVDQWVRVYVNGFQQRPAELQRPAESKSERAFETEILLNRTEGNLIEFELPGLIWSSDNKPKVEIAKCAAFKPDQWLHLLILGAGEEDGKTLLQSVLKAMEANQEKGIWRTDVFSRVERYGPLTVVDDNLTPEAVQMQLIRIRENMRVRQEAGAGDIVLIYFKGGELIDKTKGHLLLTGGSGRPGASLASADLARFFTTSRGAQLLFLDVVRPEQTTGGTDQFKQQWPYDPRVSRVGIFRSGLQTDAPRPPTGEFARLDVALQEEMPKAARLGALQSGLQDKYTALGKLYPKLIGQLPYFYVCPGLEGVAIHRKPGE
jgi:hypothetical protein